MRWHIASGPAVLLSTGISSGRTRTLGTLQLSLLWHSLLACMLGKHIRLLPVGVQIAYLIDQV